MEESEPSLPDAAHIGRTALLVADLAEVTEFYRDVVGLTVLARDETRTVLGVDRAVLVLIEDEDAAPRDRKGAGLYHNAFLVPSRAALGDALARVRERWRLDGASDHLVSDALYLTDPEGNGVEIYRDRPMNEWPTTAGGAPKIGSRPLDLDDLAAEAGGGTSAPPGTSIGHVHLEVSSMEAAREFYGETVGFTVRPEFDPSATFLAAGGYHHHVGLNTWNRRTGPIEGRGLAWFEVVVPGRSALAAARDRFENAGIPVAEIDDGIEVTDPDGIAIRLRVE